MVNALETALTTLHKKSGATMGVWFGCELPEYFEDWREEYRRLSESVGLVDKGYRAYLEFSGPDRARYLNAILTNDVKGLREKHGVVSLFLNPQGHIQAEIETYALGESLFCISYAMIRDQLIPAMDKYIIMDDVTLTDRSADFATLAVEGPKAAKVAQEVSGVELSEMEELEMRDVVVQGIAGRVSKRSPGGVAGAEFLVATEQAGALWNALQVATQREGGGPVGYRALNSIRLESGIPWFGYDFGEKQIPHEAGLEHTHISYTKGCYTGQEIVERVRSRGQVNRVRVSLRFAGGSETAPNAALLAEEKEVGSVTRVGFSPRLDCWIGMGYVRRERSAPGTVLKVASGDTATVLATPIAGNR